MVQVTDRFYIDADSKCYMLKEKTIVQNADSENFGKEIYKDLGYYSSIESCLNGILKTTTREFINKEGIKSLKELQEEIIKQNEFLKSLKLNI